MIVSRGVARLAVARPLTALGSKWSVEISQIRAQRCTVRMLCPFGSYPNERSASDQQLAWARACRSSISENGGFWGFRGIHEH